MIDVVHDAEGVRMALEEIFEEDFARARVERIAASASPEQRERLAQSAAQRTLSPGYYRFAQHLLHLEAARDAGIVFSPRDLAAFEVDGLVALLRARENFRGRHPACGSCGAPQEGRFNVECSNCGVKFQRKGR